MLLTTIIMRREAEKNTLPQEIPNYINRNRDIFWIERNKSKNGRTDEVLTYIFTS